jgi:nicotinamidase-related amidase
MSIHVPGLYPWPFDGDLRPENTALIIIDMQIDFCGEGGWVHSLGVDLVNTRRAIAPIGRLLETLRPLGYTIIHTREGHRPDLSDLPANKAWRSAQTFLVRGEPNWDIVPELKPVDGEIVIDKSGKGAFLGTDLDLILRLKGVRNLIVTGVTTDCCVQSTLRDANDRGFECVLLEDCCGAGTHDHHERQLDIFRIMDGLYGSISTSGDLIEALKASA